MFIMIIIKSLLRQWKRRDGMWDTENEYSSPTGKFPRLNKFLKQHLLIRL